ncbi:hypothetical protein F5144DRAFT_21466 [Chaetomium tenue]|uniref:Uncharacterized protein n=1 Tax=Chaetomium tenue TaxID=1854479 RepID=A0ACB7PLM3_9PEZI|nr:hypothetical protein F5144DRAFT_21466 [Chaetomium globosum]
MCVCVCVCVPPCAKDRRRAVCLCTGICAVFRLAAAASPRPQIVLYYIIKTRVADSQMPGREGACQEGRPGAKPPNLGSLFLRPTPGRKRGHGWGKGEGEGRAIGDNFFFSLSPCPGPVLANDNGQANGCGGRTGRTKPSPELIGESERE